MRPGERILTAFFAARGEIPGAIGRLLDSGVEADSIRVLPKSVHHLDDLGVRSDTKAPEGAALGAVVGGLIGALAGGSPPAA